jgi:pimeloyl-ACP methyl ester carboxylesterase
MGTSAARQRGSGLFLMEPYDPRKTPVVFVHGLLSTPLAWANVTNELWGDAEFRRRYQIWHYHYPTSAPFLYSAKIFRQQLAEARARLDPRGVHPASARIDIVAHSMGGLLTRTLITDSGEAVWNGVFRVRPEELRATAADRAEVADILHWKARREVRDVIFIATPHRGSDVSRGIVGRVGDSLTGLPKDFTTLYARLHRDNPEALQPAFREALSRGKLTSIDTLSPQHPLLATLNALPFASWVTTHSIIGNRGRKGPLERSSDGVVPYTSSHLDAAVSEVVVPTDHGAYKDPRAVAEILRILTGHSR